MTLSLQLNNEEHKYLFHISRKSQRLNLNIKILNKFPVKWGKQKLLRKKKPNTKPKQNPNPFYLLKIQKIRKKPKTWVYSACSKESS